MRYESVQRLSAEDFKRSTGVERLTFARMLEVVEQKGCAILAGRRN
jgi:hypothetical protein